MVRIGYNSEGIVTHIWVAEDADFLLAQAEANGCYESRIVGEIPELGSRVVDDEVIAPVLDPAAALAIARSQMSVSPRQLFLGMAGAMFCSKEEALAAATVGAMPAALDGLLASLGPEHEFAARVTWASMREVRRDDPLVDLIAAAAGITDPVEVDNFFIFAATL